jgi:hypothetical protein
MTKKSAKEVDEAVELATRRTAEAQHRVDEVLPTAPEAVADTVEVERRAEDLAVLAGEARERSTSLDQPATAEELDGSRHEPPR